MERSFSQAVLRHPQDEPPPGSSTIGELPSSPEIAKSGAPPRTAHFLVDYERRARPLDGRDLHRAASRKSLLFARADQRQPALRILHLAKMRR